MATDAGAISIRKLGAAHAVAEAARKVACTGATPVAATNCLNFGNPEKPEIMAQLSTAIDGIAAACIALGTPITGGNVSLYNETRGEGDLSHAGGRDCRHFRGRHQRRPRGFSARWRRRAGLAAAPQQNCANSSRRCRSLALRNTRRQFSAFLVGHAASARSGCGGETASALADFGCGSICCIRPAISLTVALQLRWPRVASAMQIGARDQAGRSTASDVLALFGESCQPRDPHLRGCIRTAD